MIYHGTSTHEIIQFHTIGDCDMLHFIELSKSATKPTFYVTCCCDEDFIYEFYMENNSDYERVKMAILDSIFNCENVAELLEELSEIFEDGFEDILVEDCDGCDFDCDNCECCKYVN